MSFAKLLIVWQIAYENRPQTNFYLLDNEIWLDQSISLLRTNYCLVMQAHSQCPFSFMTLVFCSHKHTRPFSKQAADCSMANKWTSFTLTCQVSVVVQCWPRMPHVWNSTPSMGVGELNFFYQLPVGIKFQLGKLVNCNSSTCKSSMYHHNVP